MIVLLVLSLFVLATLFGIGLHTAQISIRARAFRTLTLSLLILRTVCSLLLCAINAPACCTSAEVAIRRGNASWETFLNVFLLALLGELLISLVTDTFHHAAPPAS